jgi:hypothetical protein
MFLRALVRVHPARGQTRREGGLARRARSDDDDAHTFLYVLGG